MTTIRMATAALALFAATACARGPRFMQTPPAREWNATLAEARVAADSGRYAVAEHRLSQYALQHPGSDGARESLYWRALFRMGMTGDSIAPRLALATLEQYLASPGIERRTEATVLLTVAKDRAALARDAAAKEREIAEVRAALGRAQERPVASGGTPDQPAPDRGLAQEVERLKSELARANSELERIRKRLAGQQP